MQEWKTACMQPGQFGKRTESKLAPYVAEYGMENIRVVWLIPGTDIIFDFLQMVERYEESYLQHFLQHPQDLEETLGFANVIDNDISNLESGLDYLHQESTLTHVQDISIRRAVQRLGREFNGTDILQIRHSKATHRLGLELSPGKVLYHKPEEIWQPRLDGWWDPQSVEDFYQSNKAIQVCA